MMKFITTEHKVKCIRELDSGEVEVVDFDIGVTQVAPHVAAVLSSLEIQELEAWLKARHQLQAHLDQRPDEQNVVEVLPELIRKATLALEQLGQIDRSVKKELKLRISELKQTLKALDVIDDRHPDGLKKVGKKELLKEKLDIVKKKL